MDCDKPQHAASYQWLKKHQRLHLQHGPIDLIIEADGLETERVLAFEQAKAYFDSVLPTIVSELACLRRPLAALSDVVFHSDVAKHMHRAVAKFPDSFITPMAAVAGSVADCTLAAMCRNRELRRAFVNNGGDIALHLQSNERYTIGICESPVTGSQHANALIDQCSSVRGIATSGWQGRSHSLGIADTVTVLANNAAIADSAATLIANHIDLPSSTKVQRVAANELSHDSDLGCRAVTVDVQPLSVREKQQALSIGQQFAELLLTQELIDSAFLSLQGQWVIVGANPTIQWRQSA